MSVPSFTPMQKQYQEIKKDFQDCILLFRLGDFYEMFGDDAIIASRILGIVLTKRNRDKESEMPMCGVPYHSISSYIDKLVKNGHKVAICEQVSDPNLPGIVERKVIEVITPGTTVSNNILETKQNNFLATIQKSNSLYCLSYADLGTGVFYVTTTSSIELIKDELFRIEPTELVVLANAKININEIYPEKIHIFEYKNKNNPLENLERFFSAEGQKIFMGENEDISILAKSTCGTILNYLLDSKMSEISHLKIPVYYHLDDYIHIDDSSLRNLEILKSNFHNSKEGSLLSVIDETITSMGGRKLREFIVKPILNPAELSLRYETVEILLSDIVNLDKLREKLKNIPDIERTLGRIGLNKANARDLLQLKNFIIDTENLKKELIKFQKSKIIKEIENSLENLDTLLELLEAAIVDEPAIEIKEGGMIKRNFNPELDAFLDLLENSNKILLEMQINEQKRTGIDSLKIRFNQVFGYYIEITKAKLKDLPVDYIRKQTLVSSERFTTEELKNLEERILSAEEKSKKKEYEIFVELKNICLENIRKIQMNSEKVALLDVYQSFAYKAHFANYSKPILCTENILQIEEGRHPVISEMLDSGKFIPNDTALSEDTSFIQLLTGPNMSGKSTYLRQVALIVLMGQIGSFVPAKKLEFSPVDCIFTRVGASDNLSRGQSTFMVEMQETSYILSHATKNSLVILDEVGRGTSTYDGLSLAWAILEYIHERIRAKTIFATHYHELIAVAERLQYVRNISIEVKESGGKVIFLYKIKSGGINKSYGIFVAKLAGLPSVVLKRAIKILNNLEASRISPNQEIDLNQQTLFLQNDDDLMNQSITEINIINQNLLDDLKEINVEEMTPLEAMNKLSELKKKYDL